MGQGGNSGKLVVNSGNRMFGGKGIWAIHAYVVQSDRQVSVVEITKKKIKTIFTVWGCISIDQ